MRACRGICVTLVAVFATSAMAAEIWTDFGGMIAHFDSANPTIITNVGQTGELPMDGMDFTPDGILWGVADQELFRISQVNGSVERIGVATLPPGEIYMDISWDPSTHAMYGLGSGASGFLNNLYTIDLNTGAATLVTTFLTPTWSGGLATTAAGVRFIDNTLMDGPSRIDGNTLTYLGPQGFDSNFFGGMTIDWSRDGTLYYCTWNAGAERTEVWTLNTTTGQGTLLGPIGPDGQTVLLSAAIKPLPEPGAGAALILLLACRRMR
ncbi:MAG TPA: hypothetical protein PLP66_01385 [Phycisphaerae bacterium]|nr:hypothetical protein [Phycisphaerae bacterium]HPM22527.1 hypothetical protein [Phycisphaerae bacterium]